MGNIESGNFHHLIDREQKPELTGQGKMAENVVIEFFKMNFPSMQVRKATAKEDAGQVGFGPAKTVDAVAYLDQKPAMALQVTSSTGEQFEEYRKKKLMELKNKPFLRLEEMSSHDVAIPRALVFVEPNELKKFIADHDFAKHPNLGKTILDSTLNSLKFDLLQTKNPKEIDRLRQLISLIDEQKMILDKKAGQTT